ncbi:MAG: hypothetical protein K2Z25_15360 [Beijerinckiaceae bacterium]|nr:hypothetical protein [Beijerinckiaceae bacterium]
MTTAPVEQRLIQEAVGRTNDRCVAIIALGAWIWDEFRIDLDVQGAIKSNASIPDVIAMLKTEMALVQESYLALSPEQREELAKTSR